MADIEPIDIRFLINSDEVKKMADEVMNSVRGVTEDAKGQTTEFAAQFDAFFKKLTDSLKGAFSDVKLEGLTKQLEGVDDAGKKFSITLDFLKENLADLKMDPKDAEKFSQTIEEIKPSVEQANGALDQLANDMAEKMNVAGMSVKALEAKLTELRENAKLLEASLKNAHDPGLLNDNKKVLDEILASEIAITRELQKRNSPAPSNPAAPGGGKNVYKESAEGMKEQAQQGMILQKSMRGLFGAMTSAMVATQMLTGENKRMTETMTTLMSVYAVVRGAVEAYRQTQQLGNLITSFTTTLLKKQTVSTIEATAATSAQTVATEAATTANVALNAALKTNPIGIIVTAVVAVTTAIITYMKNTKTAAEKQKELNEALLQSRQLLSQVFDLMNAGRQDAIENAKNEITLAQARGASETEIAALKEKELKAERDVLNLKKGQNIEDVNNLGFNRAKLESLLLQQKQIEDQSDLSKGEKKELDAIKAQVAVYRDRVKVGEEITKGIRDNNVSLAENAEAAKRAAAEDAKRAAEAAKANTELARRNAVASAEARAAAETQGTAEWLKAELNAINVREQADIASARAAGETIVKIQQDAENARREAEQKFNQQQLADKISNINAQLAEVKKGSLEEMLLRTDAIRAQSEIELSQIGISAAKRAEIEAKTEKEIADVRQQYNDKIFASDLKARESNINAALSITEKGSKDELNLRKQLLEIRTLMEVQAAQKSITNEEELQAKISEIYARNLNERAKLQKEYFDKSLTDQLNAIDKTFDVQKKAVQNQSNNSPIGNRITRDNQELLAIQMEINREAAKKEALQKAFNKATEEGGASLFKLSKAIKESEQNTKALENRLKVIKNQKLLDQFAEIAGAFDTLSQGLGDLGNSFAGLNDGLADTISTMSQLAGAAGDVMQGLASGNPVGIAAGVVKATAKIISIFSAARESERKAMQELREYQDALIKNEFEYTAMMRDRARVQGDITKETVAELNARKEMLAQQKLAAVQDYEKLLAQIQQSGKQIIGKHTEKYGGFLGIGKKTRVVDDLAAVTGFNFDELEKLFTEGKLDKATASWFEELKKISDEIKNINDVTADAEEQIKQVLTGTTSESISDSIIRGFEDGKTAVEDFADSFEELMKKAILSSIQVNTLKKPLEEFYNQFAAMTESGGKLDMSEVQSLQAQYNAIIENASNQFNQLKDITGISFGLSNQPGLSGAISRTITEDTANELAGLMRGGYDYAKRQFTTLNDSLAVQKKIEANTASMVVTMSGALVELQKITVNTRDTNQSVRDLGL